ncbi:MAG: hypothetical protein IT447_13125 [Phycisphaerales bacterium]|jgi:anti-sigma factor RsiW|nr:hypothetical protein [Phycisphaerales bacterium]
MANLMQQFDNNENLLLMYLADELEPLERAHVEQLLSTNAELRLELERVRQALESALSALDGLDEADPSHLRQEAAVRQVGRMIRQWQVLHQPTEQPMIRRKGLAYPWWSYPTAAAAAVLLAFLVWWGNQSGGPINLPNNVAYNQTSNPTLVMGMMGGSLFDPTDHAEVVEPLNDAENQLAALYASSEPGANVWMVDSINQ